MNINLICEKKSYNFSLPSDVNLNYIKKLCNKIFKCETFDIFYKGDKLTKEENENKENEKIEEEEGKILLKDISNGDSNLKLKIVLNSTLSSTKNQTPSLLSPTQTDKSNKTIDVGRNDNNIYSEKIILFKNKSNKLFEAIYTQKTKKLFLTIKEFNRKIIEIDNFLFKNKSNFRNNDLEIFEGKLYDLVDRIRLYFNKLFSVLEINNYVTYNEMLNNLQLFYNELKYDEDIEQEVKCKTAREINTITSTPINKFPINLKKCENKLNLNLEKFNYFNKSSKKQVIRKDLLLSDENKIQKNFLIKRPLLNEVKKIKKEKSKFIQVNNTDKNNNLSENQIQEDKKDDNNNDNDYNNNNIDDKKNTYNNNNDEELNKKSEKDIKINLKSSKNIIESNISDKLNNTISSITKKTNKSIDSNNNNSNENILNENEEDVKINNSNSQISNNLENNNESQVVPFNLDLINKKEKDEDNNLYKEIKISRTNQFLKVDNLNNRNKYSTIKENENENITSSYDNSNNNSKNSISKNNSSDNNNIKAQNNSKKNIKQKERTNQQKTISLLINELKSSDHIDKANQNERNNNNQKRSNSENNNDKRKSVVELPIYHIYTSNGTEMAKILSRKAIMKKKKKKTSNKYDFIF